jgi:Spx/MgsR family transcriptional regulator
MRQLRVKCLLHNDILLLSLMHIYGIPNCDTVKKARGWLDEHGIEVEFHDYKKQGVPLDILRKAAKQLGWEPLINKKGPTWRKQPDEVKNSITSEKAAIEFLQATSSAIRRPLLEINGHYHLGFSPEQYEDVFGK